MATVTHYIRSTYDPNDREALELATGQVPSTTHSDTPEDHTEEPETDPWQTEKAFGVERRLAAAPRFVPAAVSYDEVNNMLGGMPRTVLDTPVEESKEDVSGWYRLLTRRPVASETATGATSSIGKVQRNEVAGPSRLNPPIKQAATLIAQPHPDKNSWFISRALQSEPASTTSTPPPTLADILAREPPIPKKPMEPPVFLALGPSNRGWGMLQQKGWSEGEGLGANVARRAQIGRAHV